MPRSAPHGLISQQGVCVYSRDVRLWIRILRATPKVALVNKTLATRYFGDWQEAIGRRFGLTTPDIEIVGMVDDSRAFGNLGAVTMPGILVPYSQRPAFPRTLEVRTSIDPSSTIADVRRAISEASPDLAIESIEHVAHALNAVSARNGWSSC
jgi:hypothetical protein